MLTVLWFAVTIMGCQSTSKKEPSIKYSLTDHELVEKIWQVKSKQFVDKQKLVDDMRNKEYVLLGETHDNPMHHNYQAWAIEQLKMAGRDMTVAFEMIDSERGEALKDLKITSSDDVFDAVQWEKSGWPQRSIYRPVFDAAINAGFNIVAANIARKELMKYTMQGESALPKAIKTQLDNNPLSEEAEANLRIGIIESHCQMLPEEMVPTMMLGQRVRDITISNSLVANNKKDGVVLIAGSGHAQQNGVPVYLNSQDQSATHISIAWMEVDERLSAPEEYSNYWGMEDLPFDYVWFTARIDRPDPCEELKKHHKFSKKEK